MKKNTIGLFLCLTCCLLQNSPVFAQTDEDVADFIKAGKMNYVKGRLDAAALEFENVLIIDKKNFLARVWLAQIYIDKKDLIHARKILTEASLQAPDHPRVIELQKLLGMSSETVKPKLVDPVIAETIQGIASATKQRTYGLVIPEDKVIVENQEKKLLNFDSEDFDEKKKIFDTIAKNKAAKEAEFSDLVVPVVEEGPLAEIFRTRSSKGLNAALDKYFELILKDPTIAKLDDKGLIDEGNRVFADSFSDNEDNLETRYYYGVLQCVNGLYEDAEEILKPLRNNAGVYAQRLAPFFERIDKWRLEENERIAALKREEEERLAREAKEKEEAEESKDDIWAKVKNKGADNASNSADLASTGNKTEAVTLDSQGYALYKKGKLDEAIAKYEEALAKDAENPEISYHLGLAYTDKGLAGDNLAFDHAITAYQKVISIATDDKLAKDATSMINDIQQAKHSLGER